MNGAKIAMAQPHTFQSGALSFMSCTSGRESSPLDDNDSRQPVEFKTETKKKRFHPLRNLRRMFRRKTRRSSISADSYQAAVPENTALPSANLEQRSCSTSRLQEENLTQNLIKNNRLNPGLSLSHDSIFTPDKADSGLSSSDLENSSLSVTVLTHTSRECPIKSQSSCSETSLLSIGSSEVEVTPVRSGGKISDFDLDLGVTAYKLSHSAAKHKMAVKPKRNHGLPRTRRRTMSSKSPLPTTMEVSEEGRMGRVSPRAEVCGSGSSVRNLLNPGTVESMVTNDGVEKPGEVYTSEAVEQDGRDDEASGAKVESFFGRFLSRRSEKKKKCLQEMSLEEGGGSEAKSNACGKKFSKGSMSPSRRQRVEPIEIPSSPSLQRKGWSNEKATPSSVSPPRNYHWPNQLTSRSMSPPKVIWPERHEEASPPSWDKARDITPKDNLKDRRNFNLMRELTDSLNAFGKDESAKRKKDEGDGENALKIRRQPFEDETPMKTAVAVEGFPQIPKKLDLSKSPVDDSNPRFDPDPEPLSASTPFTYQVIHDGYENIQIIELIKKENRSPSKEEGTVFAEAMECLPEVETIAVVRPEFGMADVDVGLQPEVDKESPEPERTSKNVDQVKESEVLAARPEAVRHAKPAVSEKPKDFKKLANQGSSKMSPNQSKAETKCSADGADNNVESSSPKATSTLVERRKSELLLLSEADVKDWKSAVKPLKKQTSFKEIHTSRQTCTDKSKEAKKDDSVEGSSKAEATLQHGVDEVILRRKSAGSHSDDQPELIKVFARRSLKIMDGEKTSEELHKSRDSDKENETLDSPKDERKKGFQENEKEEDDIRYGTWTSTKGKAANEVKVNITPLKPEMTTRKHVFQRYGRSLSENNAKKEESDAKPPVLEENSLNRMRKPTDAPLANKANEDVEEKCEEEIGFKRIQQRKAEWERRAQQGAK